MQLPNFSMVGQYYHDKLVSYFLLAIAFTGLKGPSRNIIAEHLCFTQVFPEKCKQKHLVSIVGSLVLPFTKA